MRYKQQLSREDQHVQKVAKALKDWQDSVRYFESVRDPELVDYASYGIEAARRRYVLLLRNNEADV
jgi:hypothetical protein